MDEKGIMNQKSDETENVNNSLQKVAKGSIIVFFSTIVGLLCAFIGRVMLARFFTSSEYGIFSLGFTILSISMVLGGLGLSNGVTRQIAYYLGKNKTSSVKGIIFWSILLSIFSGLLIFVTLFLGSDIIATKIFDIPRLSYPLKIFSIAIPFYILITVLSSIFRGFKKVKEKAIFVDLLRNLLFPLFLLPVIYFSLSFEWGVIAYILSIIITSFIFILYFIKKKLIDQNFLKKDLDISIGKKLLLFSFPLLIVAMMHQIMSWTDTFVLGLYSTSDSVGLYNAALPFGSFVSMVFNVMLFVYIPVASELYAREKISEMKRSYATLTKWICSVTLPMMLVLVLFPSLVLNFFFGHEYILAAVALQVLAIGFFVDNLMGPNGATLTAMGKTRFLMLATFVAAFVNVLLNVYLIPRYGIVGAAIATIVALVSINIIRTAKLYSISRIHSFEKNILKPIILSVIIVFVLYFITKNFIVVTFWMLPILFLIFIILYGFSLLVTKSFDREDIEMLINIENKMGVDLTRIKKILKKFI